MRGCKISKHTVPFNCKKVPPVQTSSTSWIQAVMKFFNQFLSVVSDNPEDTLMKKRMRSALQYGRDRKDQPVFIWLCVFTKQKGTAETNLHFEKQNERENQAGESCSLCNLIKKFFVKKFQSNPFGEAIYKNFLTFPMHMPFYK